MKKWIFISFTALIIFFISTIFIFQSQMSDKYYYSEMNKTIINDALVLEEEYYNVLENEKGNKLLRYSLYLTKYSINSGNAIVLFDKNGEVLFTSYSSSNYIGAQNGQINFEPYFKSMFSSIYYNEKDSYAIKRLDYINDEILINVHPFRDGEKLITVTSIKKTKEAITILNKLLLKVLLVVCVFMIFLINIIAKKISSSLVQLNKRVDKMMNMDFEVEEDNLNGPQEIKSLGKAFNSLAKRLGETIGKLNRANKQLRKDIDNKIKEEELRKQFVSDVSHELKTPVTIIKSHSEALIDEVGDRDYYLKGIYDETNRMNKMINEVLDLYTLESMGYNIICEELDIVELVIDNIKKFDVISKKANRKIELICDIDDGIVYADNTEMNKVVNNLIINSIIHSATKEIRVKVTGDKERIRIATINKVAGMEEGDMARIWDRFYKLDKARGRKKAGSGLGLSITKMIIEKHGGSYGSELNGDEITIWVEILRSLK